MIQQETNSATTKPLNSFQSGLQSALRARLGNITESAANGSHDASVNQKRYLYSLLKTSQKYLRDYRVSSCQQVPIGVRDEAGKFSEFTAVSIGKCESGSCKYGQLSYCGSIWQCPVCARLVGPTRTKEVVNAMGQNAKAGGQSLFCTFTQPHSASDSLQGLIDVQAMAMSKMKSVRRYKELMSANGFLGEIRGFEITHTDNGWHPHIHSVYLFDSITVLSDVSQFEQALYELWSDAVVKAQKHFGLPIRRPSRDHGVVVKLPRKGDEDEVGAYLAKWGSELTMSHTKRGKVESSRTPFQILDDLHNEYSARDHALFLEYAAATKGRARLYWSRGLKDYFDIVELSEKELADKPAPIHLLDMTWREFKALRETNMQGDILDLAERYPVNVIQNLIGTIYELYRTYLEDFKRESFRERLDRKKWIHDQTVDWCLSNGIVV